jgi:histone H3/H4
MGPIPGRRALTVAPTRSYDPSRSGFGQVEDSMAELPNAVVKRLLSKHGGGMRVSGSALTLAVEAAENYIARLAREAAASADANKRKTVMDGDIEAARQKVG